MNDDSKPESAEVDAERLLSLDPAFARTRKNVFAHALKKQGLSSEDALVLLRKGLDDMDPEIRADAAEALGFLNNVDAAPLLRQAINDDDGEVRTHAAVALIRLGDDAVFPAVVRSLRNQDSRVVIGAAVVLGHLRDARVVPNLIEAFKTEDEDVGAAIAWALGQCQDAGCVPWLLAAVQQRFATANACEALGHVGSVAAFQTLVVTLGDQDADVRAYAGRALGLLNYTQDAHLRVDAIEPLRTLLSDDSRKVRLCAALSLFELGASDGKDALNAATNF